MVLSEGAGLMAAARKRSAAYLARRKVDDARRNKAGAASPERKLQLQEARARYRKTHVKKRKAYDSARAESRKAEPKPVKIIGVDGEGQDTYSRCPDCEGLEKEERDACKSCEGAGKISDGHIYTYLAAVDEEGDLIAEAHNPDGLTHEQCAEMLLSLPRKALKFGFMFSYDVTKIIEEMPAIDRYYLMRPKTREARSCMECKRPATRKDTKCRAKSCGSEKIRKFTRSLDWRGRSYDYFNGSFTISSGKKTKSVVSTKIWDCFRFFGCAFVEALKDWKIGSDAQIARISDMKGKRGAFDQESPDAVKAYCREECHLLALMMRKVIDAHKDAGIPLKRYEGAGSTASALLRENKVGDFKGPRHADLEPALADAIASAFFGGRFEDSVVGHVDRPVHGYDISSAYPFALASLPCLACGRWSLQKGLSTEKLRKLLKKNLVLGKFYVRAAGKKEREGLGWCPLPFRSEKGSITYGTNFSGWAWGPELLAALDGWGDLVKLDGEAWIYETPCDHQPFAFLPAVYRQRIGWGKEGAGKALKLGMNASYGKCAQSLGDDPPFQSWVWAGMTTAITRAQILGAIAGAKDRWNILAIATDGIYSAEMLNLKAPPWDTGTGDLQKDGVYVPLGGWEHKSVPEGIFIAKPGLYYKMKPELKDIRARGVGRREVFTYRDKIEKGFARWDRKNMNHHVPLTSRRFYGAKHCITARAYCDPCGKSWPGLPEYCCPECGEIGTRLKVDLMKNKKGQVAYGTWDLRDVRIAFDPSPKRERTGLSRRGKFAYLTIRDLAGQTSTPYDVGAPIRSPEAKGVREAKDFQMQQPDWDESNEDVMEERDER